MELHCVGVWKSGRRFRLPVSSAKEASSAAARLGRRDGCLLAWRGVEGFGWLAVLLC